MEIKQLEGRVEKLSGSGIEWPSLTEDERIAAEAPVDETGVPEAQLTPYPEEDWVRKLRLEQEAEHEKLLAAQSLKNLTLAVKIIRQWFPGEFTPQGERTAVALLIEALERLQDCEDPHELEIIAGWVSSCVPGLHKTRKGLIHQYRGATSRRI